VTFDFDLEHTRDAGLPGDHRVQVWWRSGHLPARRSIFVPAQKCPYHVTLDLDLDHTRTLTWSPSCASLMAIGPFVCEKKRFAQKFTDRQTMDAAHSWNINEISSAVCTML